MKRDMERRLSAIEGRGRQKMVIISAHKDEIGRLGHDHAGANDLLVVIRKPTPCAPTIRVVAI